MSVNHAPILRSLASAFHKLAGATLFRVHLYERSRRHFERVLELKGDDFIAFAYLGRIAYNLGDHTGWRRECEHARRTAPERYARLKHPFELFEPRAAGSICEEAGARATWREIEVSSVSHGLEERGLEERGPEEPCSENQILRAAGLGPRPRPRHAFDDFSSDAERARFRHFSAIDAGELRRLDLDKLLRQLIS